jgi:hypothetical protein
VEVALECQLRQHIQQRLQVYARYHYYTPGLGSELRPQRIHKLSYPSRRFFMLEPHNRRDTTWIQTKKNPGDLQKDRDTGDSIKYYMKE